jgi:hypothetical protein
MSVIVRRIAASPRRTSTATWDRISELLSSESGSERPVLTRVRNLVSVLIAEEYTADAPIVVIPATGERIRLYTLHGSAAIEDEESDAPLPIFPLEEPGWSVSLPCTPDELPTFEAQFEAHPGFTVRDATTARLGPEEDRYDQRSAAERVAGSRPITVDFNQVGRS